MDKTLIFISDLHIGGDGHLEDFNCEKELIAFLNFLDKKEDNLELIILGDFFDLWKIESPKHKNKVRMVINSRKKLFSAFKKFGKKHTITVVGGNHDHELVYIKKYQDELKKYNMHVNKNQYIKRKFSIGKKEFKIIAEHGNQVEPGSEFPDFNMPTDSSLAYHLDKLFMYRFMKKGHKNKAPRWLSDADNVLIDLVPYWLISKYFYNEVGPIIKTIIFPMLALFSLAVPYFIFDLVTDFYRPKFLESLLIYLDTATFFKFIIFILYFDMVIVAILFFVSLLKKQINKQLRQYYGIQSLTEVLVSHENAYKKHSKEVLKGANPFKETFNMYLNGHTHVASLHHNVKNDTIYSDTGSWKQLMKRVKAKFNFPNVFVPYFSLSYLKIKPYKNYICIQLKERPKRFEPKLTLLEKIVTRKSNKLPLAVTKDSIIKEIKYEF